jgi:D-xylose transport system ATP-binding protein
MQLTPIIEMKEVSKHFGGIQALREVSINLYEGEILGIVGHNGAGKSKALGIETIYQHLALADNLNVPANVFLGREITNRIGILDDRAMEKEAHQMLDRLKLKISSLKAKVRNLSGGQRQCIAISRAVYFNAKILIMDEPTAALGVQETEKVHDLMKQLKKEGIAIILISHDLHDVFSLSDRIAVMKNGVLVGVKKTGELTKDDVLSMIILGIQENSAKQN